MPLSHCALSLTCVRGLCLDARGNTSPAHGSLSGYRSFRPDRTIDAPLVDWHSIRVTHQLSLPQPTKELGSSMFDPQTIAALVTQIRAQHNQLHRMIRDIERHADGLSDPTQAVDAVTQLREMMPRLRVFLQRHFEQEEQGGWLEEAACHVPRVSPCVMKLEHEHADLLHKVDQSLKLLARPVDRLAKEAPAIKALAGELVSHEAREEEVLAHAFNQEPDFAS